MKNQTIQLKNPAYQNLELRFKQWLELLNFDPSSVYYAPVRAREFFYWLEKNGTTDITKVNRGTIVKYFCYLRNRVNKRKGGKLSKGSLRTHLTTLRRLARYLRETGQGSFETDIKIIRNTNSNAVYFTREEIKSLYAACSEDVLGLRDKAMLAVFYGCGLRKSEGAALNVNDVFFDKDMLYVRKGKNYKERYVPMAEKVREHLQDYISFGRPMLLQENTKALFLGIQTGKRLCAGATAERLQRLKQHAGIEKKAGLHSLRHSIATHLLKAGMELVQIKHFLGHSTLESTQIYTHLSYENN